MTNNIQRRSAAYATILATCLLATASPASAMLVFQFDYTGTAPADAAGGRRYTTFNAGGGLTDAGNPIVAATNANTGGSNVGPGFFYIPTGVAWQPNTTYTVDLFVFDRGGFPTDNTTTVEFGLWGGLPSGAGFTELGGGGSYSGLDGTAPPQTRQALGTQGSATLSDPQVPNDNSELELLASSLIGATANTFTTGADVSALGDQVVFLRAVVDASDERLHWDNLTVTAVAIPEPGVMFFGTAACVAGLLRRRRAS